MELGHGLATLDDLAVVGTNLDHIAHLQAADIDLDGQTARVFLGVEEDRCDLVAQGHTAIALVGHKGNVFAGHPDHAVGGGFTRRTGTDHIAHIGDQVAFFLEVFDELNGAALAVFFGLEGRIRTGVLEHSQGVHGNVWAAPGIGRR